MPNQPTGGVPTDAATAGVNTLASLVTSAGNNPKAALILVVGVLLALSIVCGTALLGAGRGHDVETSISREGFKLGLKRPSAEQPKALEPLAPLQLPKGTRKRKGGPRKK